MDDFLGAAPTREQAQQQYDMICDACHYLGLPIGGNTPLTQSCGQLGMLFDTNLQRVWPHGHKKGEMYSFLRDILNNKAITRKQLDSFIGRADYN